MVHEIKSKINNIIRNWKKKYNIIWRWEVIATLFVGVMSYSISRNSNAIYQLQADIAKGSELPKFEIIETYESDETFIQIFNSGGKCYNYESEIITFLDCSQFDSQNYDCYYDAFVPIYYNYFFDTYNRHDKEENNLLQTLKCTDEDGIIDKLNIDVAIYNEENQKQELYVFVKSYIKIMYVNFIGEKETEYYCYSYRNVTLLDKNKGEKIFKYYWYCPSDFVIEWKEINEISVQYLLSKMAIICGKDNLLTTKEEEDVERIILGIIIGVGIAGGLELFRDSVRKRSKLKRYVTLLYYDLKNVENYLRVEKDDVNLLYTDDWKKILAECTTLNSYDITYLYDLYNTIYNYNDAYKQRILSTDSFQIKDISYYDDLRRKIFLGSDNYIDISRYNVKYENVLKRLEKRLHYIKMGKSV